MTILVTGGSGLLGSAFRKLLPNEIYPTHKQLDLIDKKIHKNILERSRFCLCPRGSSPSSVRFWECLAAGSIPIVISDDWILPGWDWKNTIIKIPEHEFQKMDYNDIKSLLLDIDYNSQLQMRRNCLKANEMFRKENYLSYIIENCGIRG